jgi:hypothetical protein
MDTMVADEQSGQPTASERAIEHHAKASQNKAN